jgi:hypothetical protein
VDFISGFDVVGWKIDVHTENKIAIPL